MNILGIDNIIIDVTDLDAARHFYGTVLGLTEKYAFPDRGIVGYGIGAEAPGFVLRMQADVPLAQGHGPRVWLEVEDVQVILTKLENVGVTPLTPPTEIGTGYVVEISDPFGNVIGFVDYTITPTLARANPGAA